MATALVEYDALRRGDDAFTVCSDVIASEAFLEESIGFRGRNIILHRTLDFKGDTPTPRYVLDNGNSSEIHSGLYLWLNDLKVLCNEIASVPGLDEICLAMRRRFCSLRPGLEALRNRVIIDGKDEVKRMFASSSEAESDSVAPGNRAESMSMRRSEVQRSAPFVSVSALVDSMERVTERIQGMTGVFRDHLKEQSELNEELRKILRGRSDGGSSVPIPSARGGTASLPQVEDAGTSWSKVVASGRTAPGECVAASYALKLGSRVTPCQQGEVSVGGSAGSPVSRPEKRAPAQVGQIWAVFGSRWFVASGSNDEGDWIGYDVGGAEKGEERDITLGTRD